MYILSSDQYYHTHVIIVLCSILDLTHHCFDPSPRKLRLPRAMELDRQLALEQRIRDPKKVRHGVTLHLPNVIPLHFPNRTPIHPAIHPRTFPTLPSFPEGPGNPSAPSAPRGRAPRLMHSRGGG